MQIFLINLSLLLISFFHLAAVSQITDGKSAGDLVLDHVKYLLTGLSTYLYKVLPGL